MLNFSIEIPECSHQFHQYSQLDQVLFTYIQRFLVDLFSFLFQLSIEPISGTAMQLKLRLQLNGQILKSSLRTLYPETKNVTFFNKLIPITWSETEATIDQESAEQYRSQVNTLGRQESLQSETEGLGPITLCVQEKRSKRYHL